MTIVEISVREAPPLKPGDEFDASGIFSADAKSLGALYCIDEVDRLESSLCEFSQRTGFNRNEMVANLFDVHPDADATLAANFMFDCRRSIVAHYELWS